MAELVELNKEVHRNLRVTADCTSRFAETQHVLNIRAAEVGKAVSRFILVHPHCTARTTYNATANSVIMSPFLGVLP